MTPLVSIIMPVYNAAPLVRAAIRSVIEQEYHNWELLVIDDGSKDGSRDVIQSFSDPRIRYFFQSNRGVSSARNVGLLQMRGQYLCFLDADDSLPPGSISQRLAAFEANPALNMVDGYVEIYDAAMTTCLQTWKPAKRGDVMRSLLMLKGDCFFSLTWMIRKQQGFNYTFDEEMSHAEDLFFLAGVANSGDYDYVAIPVYRYRVTTGSAMKQLDGLAKGYWQYYRKVSSLYSHRITATEKLFLLLKIRKIMFLSYLAGSRVLKAFQYLITGRTHKIGAKHAG